jgi:arylsulfatase A-like enzyme
MRFGAALLLSVLAADVAGAAGRRPSFVFILSESLDGRLLRPDSLARIPNIRALLAGGSVRFDSAYSNSPVCAPSRSSLHSGRAPHKIPHMHNGMAVSGVCVPRPHFRDAHTSLPDALSLQQVE